VARTYQEFYCGNCRTYFMLGLNSHLEGYEIEVVCPECKHEHRRCIDKGQIVEAGRHKNAPKEKIIAMKSSCHKEPIHVRMAKADSGKDYQAHRDGQVFKSDKDLAPAKKQKEETRTAEQIQRDNNIRDLWVERFGGRANDPYYDPYDYPDPPERT
jgi:hypothetical protein